MKTILIEPTDLLFFRDAVPMTAGQGQGAGCRLPFPSTLHEAFRGSLLRSRGELVTAKALRGRPRNAPRQGQWHPSSSDEEVRIASKAFASLRTIGPFPWLPDAGILLPVPGDAVLKPGGESVRSLLLWMDPAQIATCAGRSPADYRPPCLPMAATPPDKHGQLSGGWTLAQWQKYLQVAPAGSGVDMCPRPTTDLWESESHTGLEIDSRSGVAKAHQLYSGSYMRAGAKTRFLAQLKLGDARAAEHGEGAAVAALDWLLLGGEFRLARLWHNDADGSTLPDPLAGLKAVPLPPVTSGPCLLKWSLVTPAIFAHGSLPGWCNDSRQDRPGGTWPVGRVCLDLPGRAHLAAWALGKPRTVSGWDVVSGRAKPTLLAVPEGGVYYFVCENPAVAAALAAKLHWQPRSDFYGEKGCGYGLVSHAAEMHPTSADVTSLARELFNR